MADNTNIDGSVVIAVEVDSKGFDRGAGDVEKAMKSLEETLKKSIDELSKSVNSGLPTVATTISKTINDSLTKSTEQMAKTISTTLAEALKTLGTTAQQAEQTSSRAARASTRSTSKFTKEYQQLADFVAQQEKNLARLQEVEKEYNELGVPQDRQFAYNGFTEKDKPLDNSGGYASIQEQIEHYKTELEQARNAMLRLEESGRMLAPTLSQELSQVAGSVSRINFTPLDLSQYEPSVHKYVIAVNKANLAYAQQESQLRQLQAQLAVLQSKEQTPEVQQKTNEILNKIEAVKQKLQELGFRSNEAQRALNNALNPEGSGLSKILKPFKAVSSISKTVIKDLKKLGKSFTGIGKKVSKATSKFNIFNNAQKNTSKTVKKFLKQFTGIFRMLKGRVKRQLVTTIFTSITDGIKEMAKADEVFNKNISTMQSSFKQFASALVSAFSPIINIVTPIVSKITQYVTALTDKAGQLIAALTGQSTYQKAQYNYTDYAKSLDDTTESTDDLTDSTKELNKQLAAFDELNVLSTTSDSDVSSTLLDDNALNTDPVVYTEVPISFDISNLSKRIKEAFAVGDFTDLGVELGNKLNAAIAKIDSSGIGSTIARIINSASSFAVGFLDTVKWKELVTKVTDNINQFIAEVDGEQLGEAIAMLINTGFTIAFTWLSTINWDEFGLKLADTLRKIIDNVDGETIGKTFGALVQSVISIGFALASSANHYKTWQKLGKQLADIFNGIVDTIDWEQAGGFVSETIEGLLNAFASFFENTDGEKLGASIVDFVNSIDYEKIGEAFLNVLSAAWDFALDMARGSIFGASDGVAKGKSKAGKSTGNYLAEGILAGFSEGLDDTDNWTDKNVVKPIVSGVEKGFDINSPSKVMEKEGVFIAQGLLGGVSSELGEIKKVFGDVISIIHQKFSDTPDWFKEKFTQAWTNIKKVFSPVGDFFSGIWSTIKSKFTNIGTQIGEAIGGAFKNTINAVLETVENGLNFVPDTINGAIGYLNELPGVNIEPMQHIQLPRLATGTVVPANYGEFAAILGDNKRETEVVSPLSTMKQAMLEALAESGLMGGSNDGDIVINIDGREVFRVVRKQNDSYKRMHGGKSALG